MNSQAITPPTRPMVPLDRVDLVDPIHNNFLVPEHQEIEVLVPSKPKQTGESKKEIA